MYRSIYELAQDIPQQFLIAHMTDEQIEAAYRDAYLAHECTEDISSRVETFIHHELESTDMAAPYTIEEQIPQTFKDIPSKGKIHDAVVRIAERAYAAGIEHAISWILADVPFYDFDD